MEFIKKNRFMISIALLLIVVGVYTQMSQAVEMKQLVQERQEILAEKARLELVKLNLENELKNSENPAYIELLAREKLKMVKPDEIIYVIHE